MALVWDHYPNGGGELLVALKVADHADHNGDRVYPSVAAIAEYTRQSERAVQYHLRAMAKNGWLLLVKETSGKPGETRRYRVPVELIPQGVVVRVQNLHPSRVQPTAPLRVQNDAQTGATAIAPEPSVKHPSRAEARGTRLPPAWKPTPELQAWARQGRPWLDLPTVTASFIDHWTALPGARGVKLDWEATFRNWVRKERPPLGARTTGPAPVMGDCGNCGKPLTGGWTQSPKGRVCPRCHDGYMGAGWPKPELELRP